MRTRGANINFLIVHGTEGSPEGNWFPWLARALEAEGHCVVAPRFPTPEGQNFQTWCGIAETALAAVDPAQTILVGHSMGATLVLLLAQRTNAPYRAVYALCPFFQELGLAHYDALASSFVQQPLDWARIRAGALTLSCFAGSDDPYVPVPVVRDIAEKAQAEFCLIEKGGHLNAEAGYLDFPLLLEKIRQCVLDTAPSGEKRTNS